jgi:hypothetical protein
MNPQPTLIRCDEALHHIGNIADPVTRNLVNMAFVSLINRVHLEKKDRPINDLDMLFLVRSLESFFSEHGVLARTFDGEKVGAWFDEEPAVASAKAANGQ